MAAFLETGDVNRTVYEDANWKIREHCNRGFDPWFTLHKRRRIFSFAWWSGLKMWGEYDPIFTFVVKWNAWHNAAISGGGTPSD